MPRQSLFGVTIAWSPAIAVILPAVLAVACKPAAPTTAPPPIVPVTVASPAAPAIEPPPPKTPAQCHVVDDDLTEADLVAQVSDLHTKLGHSTPPKSGFHRPCPAPCVYREKPRRKKNAHTRPSFEPRPLGVDEARLCGLYLRYADLGTDPQRARQYRYRTVKLLMKHSQLAEARTPLIEFLAEDGDDELAVWAAEMYLDLLTIEWTQADDVSVQAGLDALLVWLAQAPELTMWKRRGAAELRQKARTLHSGALLIKARTAATATPPDYKACAAHYLASIEADATRAIDRPLYEAAKCLDADGDTAGARKARETLLRRTPDSRLADEVREALGQPNGN